MAKKPLLYFSDRIYVWQIASSWETTEKEKTAFRIMRAFQYCSQTRRKTRWKQVSYNGEIFTLCGEMEPAGERISMKLVQKPVRKYSGKW